MAKYETLIKGDFEEVLSFLHANIMERFSVNLVDETNYNFGDVKVGVRVYDKYYMRNGNRTSLSLTVVGCDGDLMISAIGSGGGSGVLFNFSLGAESDMVSIVENIISHIGQK